MTRNNIITTGCLGGETVGAMAPNRLEISDFIKNEKMFSLYIQALQAMMDTPQDDPESFFQIGGIHGLPYAPWDGVGEASQAEASGYCTHGSVLFPTWHRPYVALYEQILQKHAIQIARKYVFEGYSWRKVAADLRQPYWDWASNAVPPPEVISMERVTIITSDGRRARVENPLLRYRFDSVEPSFAGPFARWPSTIRHPSSDDSGAKDDVESLISTLQANQADLTSKVYNLLTRTHTWPSFSCNAPGDEDSTSNSLEAIHDAIHDCVGGPGHMGDPAYAGFDPIFMLHHAQVDRLLSLWAALHPDVGVSEATASGGTFTIPSNSTIDENTELTPFRSRQSTFWTSRGAGGPFPTHLGYSYPEFNGLDSKDEDEVAQHVAEVINNLYTPQRLQHYLLPRTTKQHRSVTWVDEVSRSLQQTLRISRLPSDSWSIFEAPAEDDELTAGYLVLFPDPPRIRDPPSHTLWEWSVRIRVKKFEVGRSFAVLVFLGEVPEDPQEWYASATYVGAHHAFVNSAPARCANCRRQGDSVTEGFVHLNDAIVKHAAPHSLEPEAMKPYLRRDLSWRVRRIDGQAISPEYLGSLEVVVVVQPLSYSAYSQQFFSQGRSTYYPEITTAHVKGSYPGHRG
ncbi:Tyrosinase [Trametes pubescens]|uniref:Tyrosinase n=1 Tax=Trametes pubescens TaxID=154538 RepID=A0A1M2VPA5_TRAPU|nr:Tyrosinase [Trametes pubescens]